MTNAKSSAVVNLPHAVIQEHETRWYSKVAMMQSVSKHYREIQQAMKEKDQLDRLDGIQLDVLNTITEFLLLFKTASEELNHSTSGALVLQTEETVRATLR